MTGSKAQRHTGSVLLVRRSFLAGLGLATAGLALGFTRDARADDPKMPPSTDAAAKNAAASAGEGLRPNLFVHVSLDDVVSIVCARSEMGQGVRSSLPVLIADELGADMARVKIVQGDGNVALGDQNTDGSHSVRGFYDELRRVGAVARTMLVSAAAKRWRVPEKTCDTRDGAVYHEPTGRHFRFGELAIDASKLPLPDPKSIVLRPASRLKHVGKELPLLDGPDLVTGRAVFGADVKLPGMLTAVIARSPVPGGRATAYDAKKALAVPGVKRVIELPAGKRPFGFRPLGGIAVVADNTWAALRGRAALEVTWDPGDNRAYDSTSYREELVRSLRSPVRTWRNRGDVEAALQKSKRRVAAVYHVPHLAHAPMEPPCAVAKVEGKKCEIWASTQNPQDAQGEVAAILGLDPNDVIVHVTFLGGGFGRKSKPDYVVEAALVSREMKAPVRLQWTREDDVRHDYYHSVSAQELVAGVDDAGEVVAWRHRTAFPPIGSTFSGATSAGLGELQQGVLDVPLAIPNVRAESCEAHAHTRIGWLRSVANIYHAFAVQSFVDEIAHSLEKDPLDMRLELLGPPRIVTTAELGVEKLPNYGQSLDEHPIDTARHRAVLERVAAMSGWRDRQKNRRSLGIAVHRSFLAYVAVVVGGGRPPQVRVHADECWICADAGTIVNLDRVRAQLEGAVIFGLSHALYGEITMKNGATEQSNFRDYRLLRMNEAPRAIHVEVMKSTAPPGGVGEPGVPPVAPALANAVFALTGTRVRDLPLVRSLAV